MVPCSYFGGQLLSTDHHRQHYQTRVRDPCEGRQIIKKEILAHINKVFYIK
jgi:hypothetical protein